MVIRRATRPQDCRTFRITGKRSRPVGAGMPPAQGREAVLREGHTSASWRLCVSVDWVVRFLQWCGADCPASFPHPPTWTEQALGLLGPMGEDSSCLAGGAY